MIERNGGLMEDTISRKKAIDAICEHGTELERRGITVLAVANYKQVTVDLLEALPSAQPETHEERTETHGVCLDAISRQAARDAVCEELDSIDHVPQWVFNRLTKKIEKLPSAQPTLYGYNIEHLELIARVLQKEDLPPERVVEVLTDVGRIVAIVRDEFEETLRKAVEQCMT